MSVSKANYAPFNPDILSFPAVGVLASEGGEGKGQEHQEEQHVSSTPVPSGDISADGTPGPMSHLKPGYKSFNFALLGGFEHTTPASFQNTTPTTCITAGPGSEATGSEQVPTPQSSASLAGSHDDPDRDLPDVRPPVDHGQGSSPTPLHSSETPSTDQRDVNPFQRVHPSTDFSASSTADDAACGLFNEAGSHSATPRQQFAAALAMRDAAAARDPPMRGRIPNPCAEVDPGDYG